MAEHADATELKDVETVSSRRSSGTVVLAIVGSVAVCLLVAAAGWLGFQLNEKRQEQHTRALFVEAARQGAINLTTINYATVDTDIARILDSSTGTFHDDFERRSKPFADVVRHAQSKSEGSVTTAALASRDGDQAEVLVTVSMTMSSAGAAEPEPRAWRMRIGVRKTGDVAKVSDVRFVG